MFEQAGKRQMKLCTQCVGVGSYGIVCKEGPCLQACAVPITLAHDVTDLLNLFLAASLLSLKDWGVMGRVFPSGGFVHTGTGVLQVVFKAVSVGVHVSSWLLRLRRIWGDSGIACKGGPQRSPPTPSVLQKEQKARLYIRSFLSYTHVARYKLPVVTWYLGV